MFEVTLSQWFGVLVGFFTIFPTSVTFSLYFKYRISEYLTFSLFFTIGICVLFLDPIAGITNLLIIYQLHHLFIDLAYVILFIHSIRLIWLKPPRIIWAIGLGWCLLLFLLTLPWTVFVQPESSQVLFNFLILPHSYSSYFPEGAGLIINGIIIYSTGFRYIGELFRIFCLMFSLYAYSKLELLDIKEYKQHLEFIRRLWILVWIMMLIHSITLFPWFFPIQFISISLLIAGSIIFYIAIFTPEGLVISHVQFIRASKMFRKIKNNESSEFNLNLREFVNSIPDSYWNDLIKIKDGFYGKEMNNERKQDH